jgi:hypothetical protein
MTCHRRSDWLLQATCLGLVGILAGVGCGGSSSSTLPPVRDGSVLVPDGAPADSRPSIPDLPQGPSLKISPAALPFGEIDVGQASPALTVTVTNTGALTALNPTVDVAAFAITSTTCSTPAASCTISVVFSPTTAGAASGALTVAGGLTVSLSGIGRTPGTFTATPSAIPATVNANQSVPFTVTVTATAALAGLTCTSSSPDITVDPTVANTTCTGTMVANTPCTYGFTFKAATAGAKNDTIVCSAPATGTGTPTVRNVAVTTTVLGPPILTIAPNPGSFAATVGTTGQPVIFNVGNAGGTASGVLTTTFGGANAAEFTATDNKCVVPLAPLATCAIQVVFKPAAAGNRVGTITVSDATTSTTVVATLNGIAVTAPTAVITGTSNLGDVQVGKPGITTLTITNSGGDATGALTIAAGDPQFVVASGCGVGLAAGATCTATVTFTPTSAGAKSTVVTVTSGGTTLGTVQVQGNGTAPPSPPSLNMTPANLDFGTIGVGTSSTTQSFTVTNSGGTATLALTVTNVGVGGASQFTFTSLCTGVPLAGSATCQVVVTFKPTVAGPAQANFTVGDGTYATPTRTVVGTALETPGISISCPQATFEDTVVGATSSPITCTVTNDINSVQATGTLTAAATNDFAVIASSANDCTGQSLPKGGQCPVTVVFKPTAKGLRTGTLTVTGTNGSAPPQALTGTGLGVVEIQEFTAPTDGTFNPVSVTSGNYDFGTVSAGATSDNSVIMAVYVRGPGVANLKVTKAFGTPSADFTQISDGADSIVNLTWPDTSDHVIVPPCVASTTGTLPYSKTVPYCTLVVKFTPQSRTPVAKNGTVTATAADATMTDSATVHGSAAGPIEVKPSPLDFDPVAKGTEGTAVTLTVCNNSTTNDATGASFTITGTNAPYFAVARDELTGVTIPSGGTNCAHLALRLVIPADAAAGALSATLQVSATVNGATESDTSALTGSVVGNGPVLTVVAPTSPADFGAAPVTGTSAAVVLTVRNDGNLDTDALTFTIPDSNEFSMTRGTCGGSACASPSTCTTPALASAGSCTMNLFFKPTAALGVGTRTGTLTIFSDNAGIKILTLTGSATSQITVSPGTVTFPVSGLLGAASPTTTITITNQGGAAIAAGALAFPFTDFGLQSGSGDFLVVPGSNCADGLAAGGDKCTVDVQMNAQSLGTSSTTMVAQDTANGQSANVVLTGTGAAAVLVFTPATDVVRDFGTVRKGDVSAPLTYTVRNVGGLASGVITFGLYEDAAGTTPHTTDFSFAGSTCGVISGSDGTLAAGASCNVQVAFSPVTATVASLPLEYLIVKATPGPAAPGLVSKTISAAAADAASVYMVETVSGKPVYDFGTSATAKTITLAIHNASAATFTPTAPTFSNAEFTAVLTGGAAGTCGFVTGGTPATLAAGTGFCTFQVTWTPVTTTTGTRTVVVTSATAATMVMYGRVAGPAVLRANPSALDFGNVSQNNGATVTLSVVVTNIGDSATTGNVGRTKDTGTGSGDLSFGTGCTGAGIAAGGSCTLPVIVNPSSTAIGDVIITVQSTPTESVTIHATWQGVDTNPPAIARAPTGTLDLGNWAVLATSDPVTVTLTNGTKSLPTGPLSFAITGDFAVQSATTGTGCGAPAHPDGLNAGDSCTVTVTFTPKTLGTGADKTGSLTVTSLAPTVTIPLSGTPIAALGVGTGAIAPAEATTAEDPLRNAGCTFTGATGGANARCAYPTTKVSPVPTSFASETFTFQNTDGAPPTGLLLAQLTGAEAGNYQIVYDTCTQNVSLGSSETCKVTVRFEPTSTANNPKTATLTVSGTPGDSISVDLTGSGN